MSIRAFALTTGIFGAATMFFLSWWLILIGNAEGPVTLLERIYIGYSFTPMGSVIGALWGFVDFGIAGAIFAWLYNKINPGKPIDEDLYAMPEDKVKNIPTVCGSLREAMESLDRDRKFLTQGEVFTDDQIDAYIALKFEEIYKLEHTPHPIEFDMYYSC